MDLVFEVVSFEGPVSRALVKHVATVMMGYTEGDLGGGLMRGSGGVGGGGGVWIVLRIGERGRWGEVRWG